MTSAERKDAVAKEPTPTTLVLDTFVSTSGVPPPMAPQESVYPSKAPSSLLYLRSPAVGEPGLCPVLPAGSLM